MPSAAAHGLLALSRTHQLCPHPGPLQAPRACGPLSCLHGGLPVIHARRPLLRGSCSALVSGGRLSARLSPPARLLWFVSSPLCRHGSSLGRRRLLSRGLPYTPAGVSSAHTRGPVRNAFSSRSWGASPRGPQKVLRHCLGLWRRGRRAQPSGAPWGVRAPEGCWSECVRGWRPGRGADCLSQLRTRGICGASRWCTRSGSPSVGSRTRRSRFRAPCNTAVSFCLK